MAVESRFGLALSLALVACGDGGGASSGPFHACGGKLEGKWKIVRIDLTDPSMYIDKPFENQPACIDTLGDVMLHVDGSYAFGKDMSLKIELGLAADLDVTLDEKCVQALAMTTKHVGDATCSLLADTFEDELGMKAASCSAEGHMCECSLSSDAANESENTTYQVRGQQLVVGGTVLARDYCVRGDRLEIRIEQGMLDGILVLER